MHRLAPLIVTVLVGAGCQSAQRVARAPQAGEATVTVMTYNVNYGLAGDPATIAAIGSDADVVRLQETTLEWEQALRAACSGSYPHIRVLRTPLRAGGQVILSKFPLRDPVAIGAQSGWFPSLRLIVDSPIGELQLLGLHLRPPVSDSGSYVSGYLQASGWHALEVADALPALRPGIPTLVLGDFNESSGGAVERLEDLGYRDALSEFDPGATTWRWPFLFTELRMALDHLIYSPELEPLSAEVRHAGRSDHLPVLARFARAR